MLLLHVLGLLLLVSCVFLKLCGTQDIECTVTQDGGRTRYSVPESTAKDCHYSWLTITNRVLANQGERTDDQVVMKSDCTLLTSMCSELIRYSGICNNEGVKREATCTTNCSGNAGLQNGGETQTATQTAIPRNHWIVLTVVLLVVLVLVVLGLLRYKSRDNIHRRSTNLSTSVKMQDNPADVEGQHG